MNLYRYFSDGNLTKNEKDDLYCECFVFCEIIFSLGGKIIFPVDLFRAVNKNKKGDDADA